MKKFIENIKNNDPKLILIIGTIILIISSGIFFISSSPSRNVENPTVDPPIQIVEDDDENLGEANKPSVEINYENLMAQLKEMENKELKQLEDFLNNRANRIATKELLDEIYKEKVKINELIKEYFIDEYKKDYTRIDESLKFTEEAMEAFNGKNAITDIKRLLKNKNI